jgi:four helix bundle protein
MKRNSRADDLEERLIQFAIAIVTLVGQLPQNFQAKHIATQLLRSGTAAAPNYGEARAAESRADFIHKLKIALKELNETAVWLRIIERKFRCRCGFSEPISRGKYGTLQDLGGFDSNSTEKG